MVLSVLRHPRFLVVLSGLLLALSFPSANFGPLAFVAVVPLLAAIDGVRARVAFWRGLGAGFVFFAVLYSWMTVLAGEKTGWAGYISGNFLALLQAFFTGVFAAFAAVILRSKRVAPALKLVAIPSVWVVCEYVRQLGSLGMGWGDIGYTQWQDLPLLRIAPLAGIWGLTWVVVLVNTALHLRRPRLIAAGALLILLLIGVGPLAEQRVHASGPSFQAAALQANISQDVLWQGGRPADPAYFVNTLNTFADMARQAKAGGAQLCVLGETATPGYVRFDPVLRQRVESIASENDLTVLAGGRDYNASDGKDRNVAVLFVPHNPPQGSLQMYAKQQLVPFGEYVPYQDELKWLKVLQVLNFNDEPGGPAQPPLDAGAPSGRIGTAICYESSYPRFLRQQAHDGANVLTVITYDGWYGHSGAARQHLAMSAVRAAECDRYLVRCAATGMSAIFAPNGREMAEAGLYEQKIVMAPLTPYTGDTLFVRYGDWFAALCGLVALAAVVTASPLRPRSAGHLPDKSGREG